MRGMVGNSANLRCKEPTADPDASAKVVTQDAPGDVA